MSYSQYDPDSEWACFLIRDIAGLDETTKGTPVSTVKGLLQRLILIDHSSLDYTKLQEGPLCPLLGVV